MHATVSALPVLAAEGGGGGNDGHGLPIFPHTSELIFALIFMAILITLVAKFVVPKLEAAYQQRVEAIEGGMERAVEAQTKAEEALAQYQAQLAEARDEAARIREEAREQGAAIKAELREAGQAEADRITSAAHQQIEAERQQALVSLRSELGRLSTDLASRIVGESLHEETRQKGIVERFLAQLESGELRPEDREQSPVAAGAPAANSTPADGAAGGSSAYAPGQEA